jgi:putative endonuclease
MKQSYAHNKAIGNKGEDIAASYLQNKGYEIVERNLRLEAGEIDIIARDKHTLVFVEVKTRSTAAFGSGAEAVNLKKQQNMLACAELYTIKNNLEKEPVRIDVIEIMLCKNTIRHIKDAIVI